MGGFEVGEALKAESRLADGPVIFVTAHGDRAFELKGLEIGAVDFLAKPIDEPLLLARVRTQLRLKHLSDELRQVATLDTLTETVNRRAFDKALARERKRGRRSGDPIRLLMVDIEHVRSFNDTRGRHAGDECLRAVAALRNRAALRPADVLARHSGQKLALLLPQTPRAGAERVANRVPEAVEAARVPHPTSPTSNHVTASIGVGCCDRDREGRVGPSAEGRWAAGSAVSAAALVQSADQAWYAAQRGGRAQARQLDIAHVNRPQRARHRRTRHARHARCGDPAGGSGRTNQPDPPARARPGPVRSGPSRTVDLLPRTPCSQPPCAPMKKRR